MFSPNNKDKWLRRQMRIEKWCRLKQQSREQTMNIAGYSGWNFLRTMQSGFIRSLLPRPKCDAPDERIWDGLSWAVSLWRFNIPPVCCPYDLPASKFILLCAFASAVLDTKLFSCMHDLLANQPQNQSLHSMLRKITIWPEKALSVWRCHQLPLLL